MSVIPLFSISLGYLEKGSTCFAQSLPSGCSTNTLSLLTLRRPIMLQRYFGGHFMPGPVSSVHLNSASHINRPGCFQAAPSHTSGMLEAPISRLSTAFKFCLFLALSGSPLSRPPPTPAWGGGLLCSPLWYLASSPLTSNFPSPLQFVSPGPGCNFLGQRSGTGPWLFGLFLLR